MRGIRILYHHVSGLSEKPDDFPEEDQEGVGIGRARYLFKRRYESKVDSFIYRKHWQVAT